MGKCGTKSGIFLTREFIIAQGRPKVLHLLFGQMHQNINKVKIRINPNNIILLIHKNYLIREVFR